MTLYYDSCFGLGYSVEVVARANLKMMVLKQILGSEESGRAILRKGRQAAPTVKEGLLYKLKGMIGVGKVWAQKYFVLNGDALYYSNNKEFSHTAKKICMVNVSIRAVERETKRKFSIAIFDSDKRAVCVLAADSEKSLNDWLGALTLVKDALSSVDVDSINFREGLMKSESSTECLGGSKIPTRELVMLGSVPDTASQKTTSAKPSAPHLSQLWNGVIPNYVLPENQIARLDVAKSGHDTFQVDSHALDKSLTALIKMGYSQDCSMQALKRCGGRLDEAVLMLSRRSGAPI